MIIVKLMGGLGNQLFQYAVGRRISFLHNVKLKLDLTSFKENKFNKKETPRNYALKYFNIVAEIATEKEIRKFKVPSIENFKKNNLNFISNYFFKKYIKEEKFYFNPLILQVKNNLYLDGYWQSEDYFNDIADIIKQDITLKKEYVFRNRNILNEINDKKSVSLHFRRGDYLKDPGTNKFHGTCSLSYYQKSIDYITENIGKKIHLFIFSDDIEWVKNNFKNNFEKTYIESCGLADYEELILMSKCKHNVVANSSFSWWAAWLNKNKDKIVVSPSRWFAIDGLDTPQRIPKEWHQIKTTLVVDNNLV